MIHTSWYRYSNHEEYEIEEDEEEDDCPKSFAAASAGIHHCSIHVNNLVLLRHNLDLLLLLMLHLWSTHGLAIDWLSVGWWRLVSRLSVIKLCWLLSKTSHLIWCTGHWLRSVCCLCCHTGQVTLSAVECCILWAGSHCWWCLRHVAWWDWWGWRGLWRSNCLWHWSASSGVVHRLCRWLIRLIDVALSMLVKWWRLFIFVIVVDGLVSEELLLLVLLRNIIVCHIISNLNDFTIM